MNDQTVVDIPTALPIVYTLPNIYYDKTDEIIRLLKEILEELRK